MDYQHVPVMLKEVLECLDPKPLENFIDGTFGGGGYSSAIIEKCQPGIVLATDADQLAHDNAKINFNKNKNKYLILVHDNFSNLQEIVQKQQAKQKNLKFNGLVLDLGLSGAQLEDRDRGFSFKLLSSPLEMAFGQSAKQTSFEILNTWSEQEIAKIIWQYGEESFNGPIAKSIIARRKVKNLETVGELVEAIEAALPRSYINKQKIHFATKTFQAIRIATNEELASLEKVLKESLNYLEKGARIVVVSYHSLEDRIVKDFFRAEAKGCICPPVFPICQCNHKARLKIINKKIKIPSLEELKLNPKSRSAKLRSAVVI
ncbi:MAG: 16S rRNA (cytosine(1402)-N(4))-methyltransferase RsmH [bacterium]